MAKTFKQILGGITPETLSTPISSMDILDVMEMQSNDKNQNTKSKENSIKSKEENIKTEMQIKHSVDVRQSFIIGRRYLEMIKNVVYTNRKNGAINYNQKDCIEEALDLLFSKLKIEERPTDVIKKEQDRGKKIKNGIANGIK